MEALLLTIYFIVIFFVLYKMALALEERQEKRVKILLDTKFMTEQTESQLSCLRSRPGTSPKNIADSIEATTDTIKFNKREFPALGLSVGTDKKLEKSDLDRPELASLKQMGMNEESILRMFQRKITIRVSPTGKQTMRKIFYMSVLVNNQTEDIQLYINWDNSSIVRHDQGHRVVRSTPNMPMDLSQQQVYSVVNPGQSVSSDITIEKNFAFDPEERRMQIADPLVDLESVVEFAEEPDPTSKEPLIQGLYNLDLMIGIKRTYDRPEQLINLLVPFGFTAEIEVSQIAFLPLRVLLRYFGNNSRQRQGSWFFGRSKAS